MRGAKTAIHMKIANDVTFAPSPGVGERCNGESVRRIERTSEPKKGSERTKKVGRRMETEETQELKNKSRVKWSRGISYLFIVDMNFFVLRKLMLGFLLLRLPIGRAKAKAACRSDLLRYCSSYILGTDFWGLCCSPRLRFHSNYHFSPSFASHKKARKNFFNAVLSKHRYHITVYFFRFRLFPSSRS